MEKVTQSLGQLAEAFLLTKQVSGCTAGTLLTYRWWLHRLVHFVGDSIASVDPISIQRFFSTQQSRGLSTSSLHQAYRTVKTFLRWGAAIGALPPNLMAGFTMRTPKTLPQVPTEDEIRAVLKQCPQTLAGRRNRCLVLVMADAGLRAGEVLRLLIEHWNPSQRSLFVRGGKGRKDRVVFISPTTVRAIRDYLGGRQLATSEDFLFVDSRSRPLKQRHLVQILHRLSQRAGLPPNRRLHPHSLRHFAATSWLRNGVGLDEVRRLLGHESLNTTLRYSSLVSADLQQAHRRAGAIERMRLD